MTAGMLLLWGCTEVDPQPIAGPLDGGWPAALLARPASLSEAIAADREGWIRLHRNDLHGALERGGEPGQRAAAALSQVEQDLALLSAAVWERTFSTWDSRSGIPAGSAMPVIAALAAIEAEAPDRARSWLARGGDYSDPAVADLAAQLSVSLDDVEGSGLAGCIAAHRLARAQQDLAPLSACPEGPLITEQTTGHSRTLYSPLIFGTLAAVHAPREAPLEGLAGLLFSSRWAAGDDGLAGTLTALGLTALTDDPQSARDLVRQLDAHLDAFSSGTSAVSTEGAAVLDELQLVAGYRARLLTDLARRHRDTPQVALALGQLALDVEHSRAVSTLNPPGLFVTLATASFQSGRSRAALEYLAPLASSWPEIVGLDETLSDLVVLEGLERLGDSKEN
ncbi:MAG: hypothetical protein P8R54_21495 [Myxococcota bacterium]|nr:hypothetical protein [Myxococcota bacterium]